MEITLPAAGAPATQPIPRNMLAWPKLKLNNSGPAITNTHSFAVGAKAALKNPKTNAHMTNPGSVFQKARRMVKKPKVRDVTVNV